MKPTLPHDVCRCLGLDCDVAETCLRYLCRQDVGPGTPFMEGVGKGCLYRMPSESSIAAPRVRSADDYCDDDYCDDDCCPMCGGDGVVMLSDCGPSEWGEDCFSEKDRVVECPECRERDQAKIPAK